MRFEFETGDEANRQWWRRLWSEPAVDPVEVTYEPLHGTFATIEEAQIAARVAARSLTDPIEGHVGVAILDFEGGEVGGFWAGDGGSF